MLGEVHAKVTQKILNTAAIIVIQVGFDARAKVCGGINRQTCLVEIFDDPARDRIRLETHFDPCKLGKLFHDHRQKSGDVDRLLFL